MKSDWCQCGDPHTRVYTDREDGFGTEYCVSCGKLCGGAMSSSVSMEDDPEEPPNTPGTVGTPRVFRLSTEGKRKMINQMFLGYIGLFLVANFVLYLFLKYVFRVNLNATTTAVVVLAMLVYAATRAWRKFRDLGDYEIWLGEEEVHLKAPPADIAVRRRDIEQLAVGREGFRIVAPNNGGFWVRADLEGYEELKRLLSVPVL